MLDVHLKASLGELTEPHVELTKELMVDVAGPATEAEEQKLPVIGGSGWVGFLTRSAVLCQSQYSDMEHGLV